ncbi:hypothetical protein [Sandaracinus amylolyticus]|uniref:Uncharacterized protein n=1 Tax=Sandaracinus amylolyticus TaxID=927083 RepID=A0A0F6SGQ0_9BACT|nr:hypothetical protein [Sandaracinus amylolyticus]AKF09079.1 hypothetical protein DB32_006228 [Sandaracinus amylolyticus]
MSREIELFVEPAPSAGYRDSPRAGTLRIEHTWRDAAAWRGAPAALPWLGVGIALGALGVRAGGDDPRASLALLGIVAAWLSLTVLFAWEVLARLVNRTRITFDQRALRVVHGPVPLATLRSLRIVRSEIAAFFVEPRRTERGELVHHVAVETVAGVRTTLLALACARRAVTVRDALARHLAA